MAKGIVLKRNGRVMLRKTISGGKITTTYRRKGFGKKQKKTNQLLKYGDSVMRFNVFTSGTYRISRTCNNTVCYSVAPSTAGPVGYAFIFDPSGSYNNHGVAGVGVAMPDWSNFIAIFNQYRVRKVIVKSYVDTTGNLDTDPVSLWQRYNYELAVTGPTISGIEQLNGTVKKTFSSQHNNMSYTIYPKSAFVINNSGILSAQGHGIKGQPWTDVNSTCQLLGFQFVVDNTTASQTLKFEIEYDIEFKYNK